MRADVLVPSLCPAHLAPEVLSRLHGAEHGFKVQLIKVQVDGSRIGW